jgi:hypothetical protein
VSAETFRELLDYLERRVAAGEDVILTPDELKLLEIALDGDAVGATRASLHFRVIFLSGTIETVLGASSNAKIAQAIFDAAVALHADLRVQLKVGARILKEAP